MSKSADSLTEDELKAILEEINELFETGQNRLTLSPTLRLVRAGYYHDVLVFHAITLALDSTEASCAASTQDILSLVLVFVKANMQKDNENGKILGLVNLFAELRPKSVSRLESLKRVCMAWWVVDENSARAFLRICDQATYQAYLGGDDSGGRRYSRVRSLFPDVVPHESIPKGVSFVVPVIDLSPGTPKHNFLTLLDSINELASYPFPVETVVVFNNPALGSQLQGHPSISRSAIMSCNIGVSRAWSVGINMARTEFSIVVNADVILRKGIIEDLVGPFLDDAFVSMTGPVGFQDDPRLPTQLDYRSTTTPTIASAIAGFLFCIRTREFQAGRFYFDPQLTPAFSEEEDLSVQFKRAGARMVAIPTDKFEHGGSGSHIGRSVITYFDQSIEKITLLARNLHYVRNKWVL